MKIKEAGSFETSETVCRKTQCNFDVHGTVYRECIPLSITNKMQRYTIFFIIVNALHVTGGISAHHQELKNCTHSIGYMSSLLPATDSEDEFQLTHACGSSKQA